LTGETLAVLGVSTLAEALELTPSLSVSPVGTTGALATISLRGSTSNQVLVLVDGIRVSDPGSGQVDLSRLGISIGEIESIQIVRGGVGARYGADAVGGVVIIMTKHGAASKALTFKAENSSFLPASFQTGSGASAEEHDASPGALIDGQRLSFRAGLPGGLALSGGVERASNAYTYYDSNFVRRIRQNADLLAGRASLSWKGAAGEGRLAAKADLGGRSLGGPGSLGSPSPEARQKDIDARLSSSYATDYFLSEIVGFSATAYGSLSRIEYRADPALSADLHDSLRTGIDASWSILASEKADVDIGVSGRYDRLDSTTATLPDGSAPRRTSLGIYAEPSLIAQSWSFHPALRWDWTNDFPSGISAGLEARKNLTDRSSVAFSASTAYRAPSFDDLYWPAAQGVEGNPDLDPETAYCADLGYRWEGERDSLSISAYARYSKGVILWQENDDGVWRPSNFGDALYPGLEAELLVSRSPWRFVVSYSFIRSYVLSGDLEYRDDKRVPNVPVHSLDAAASYGSKSIAGSIKVSYKGPRYLTTDNKAYLPSLFLLGADLKWRIGEDITVFWEGNNLLNERYESVQDYPMPGFSMTVGLQYLLESEPKSR